MRKRILASLCIIIFCAMFAVPANAMEYTTYTYTISVDGKWTRTQFAYQTGGTLLDGITLSEPGDLFYKNGYMYIADTAAGRIIKYNLESQSYTEFGEGVLKKPSGLFVKNDGSVYVADPDEGAVFLFDAEGTLKNTIGKPESNLYPKERDFKPKNVVLSSTGNLFVVGIGSYEGLMQFDETGKFHGFFAANQRNLSFLESIQELIYNDQQKAQQMMRTSKAFENIDISDRDLIFSITQSTIGFAWRAAEAKSGNNVKLHNMAGRNILGPKNAMNDEWNFVDIAAGINNNCYAVTQSGLIYEYDSNGELIFSFGGRAVSSDKNGLFTNVSAIETDDKGVIYVLDSERGIVQVFYPGDFANLTHEAIGALERGEYSQSEELWKDILSRSGMSRIAHLGYGKTLMHQGKYTLAMEHFKIANNKEYYSEAFWNLRNDWLNSKILWVFIVLVGTYVIFKLIKLIKSKNNRKNMLSEKIAAGKKMLFHPIDLFYDLKHRRRGSVKSAFIILALAFAVFLSDMFLRGFLFMPANRDSGVLPIYSLLFIGCAVLWIFGSTMVGSINQGEGSLRDVFLVSAYSLIPYLLITPIVIFLSYFLSLNEAFIIQMLSAVGIVWSLVYLLAGIMEVHAYNFSEMIKNVILTLFFMILAVVAIAMMVLIWKKAIDFFHQLWKEVIYNVRK